MKRLDALAKKLEGADLFAPLPPMDDSLICFVPLPRAKGYYYQGRCGKTICFACFKENDRVIKEMNGLIKGGAEKKKIESACPFCREPDPIGGRYLRQLEFRGLRGDAHAYSLLGTLYEFTKDGKCRDRTRALQYFIQAAGLGSEDACAAISSFLNEGTAGIPVDKITARLFCTVAALRGHIQSRHEIGYFEYTVGNHELGIRHWKISATAGYQDSLNRLRDIFNANVKLPGKEFISKEDLSTLYRKCHDVQKEVKSEEREKYLTEEDKRRAWY